MIELFEFVLSNPLGLIAGFGISSATIYTIIKIFSCIFSLFTKKKKLLNQNLINESISTSVINKLGGINNFSSLLAEKVVNSIIANKQIINSLKTLEKLQNTSCPNELKAYIKTIITQTGNQDIYLEYERNLHEINIEDKNKINSQMLSEDIKIDESKQIESLKPISQNNEDKEIIIEDGDIDYA